MTTLVETIKNIQGPELGPSAFYPMMREGKPSWQETYLGEEVGLFANYGAIGDYLPYTAQDNYDGPVKNLQLKAMVLENDYIKATFIPSLGGRLWSIYDKTAKRDLILDNSQFMPRNLAIRNAWFAGGIEYNCGRFGHDPQTCSQRFLATLKDTDGTPVLRFYEFQRDRAIPFQIDFYLPEMSRFLLARMRIMNIRDDVVPMYWWSNIAAKMTPGMRIVVPSNETFDYVKHDGKSCLSLVSIPSGQGFDATYPENFPSTRDNFYNLQEGIRRYEAVVNRDGYAFLFASTRQLRGRKLFVWGENVGGHNWQRKLVGGDKDNYVEVQGGIGRVQQECIPMPPKTTFEWIEAYGGLQLEPDSAFGSWDAAKNEVLAKADQALPEAYLDAELNRTKASFALKPGKVLLRGSGWGALEEKRLGHKMTQHLDFGLIHQEQQDWLDLLKFNAMSDDAQNIAYMTQQEWLPLLEKAEKNWKTCMHLALFAFRQTDYPKALLLAQDSLAFQRNKWNEYVYAVILLKMDRAQEGMEIMRRMMFECPDDPSLAKEALKICIDYKGDQAKSLECLAALSEQVLSRPMIRYYKAYALAYTGHYEEAREILVENGGLRIPDTREGATSLPALYIYIMKQMALREGRVLEDKDIQVPQVIDLRMRA